MSTKPAESEGVVKEPMTRTGQGLMTIFLIGLVHEFLNIQLATKSIKIPWLPEVMIKNPEGITYAYMCLLGYAIYRYSLHNSEALLSTLNKGVVLALKSSLPKSLWLPHPKADTLFTDTTFITGANLVYTKDYVHAAFYPSGIASNGYVIIYQISLVGIVSVKAAIKSNKNLADSIKKDLERFGFYSHNYQPGASSDFIEHLGVYPSMSYQLRLCLAAYVGGICSAFSDKDSFEAAVPLIATIGMLTYLIIQLFS